MLQRLKEEAMKRGMKIISNPKVMKMMSDPRLMNALSKGFQIKGRIEEQVRTRVQMVKDTLGMNNTPPKNPDNQ